MQSQTIFLKDSQGNNKADNEADDKADFTRHNFPGLSSLSAGLSPGKKRLFPRARRDFSLV
jgi:hypothetical protein